MPPACNVSRPASRSPYQVSLDAEDIRNEKVKVLRSMVPVQLDDVVLGQYKGRWGSTMAGGALPYCLPHITDPGFCCSLCFHSRVLCVRLSPKCRSLHAPPNLLCLLLHVQE